MMPLRWSTWIMAAPRPSVLQRQGHPAPVPRRKVGGDEELQRVEAFPPVGVGLGLAAERLDHVVVVERMPEAVDRRGLVARLVHLGVVRIGVGEAPVLDLVDGYTPDPHGALLADDGDRALEIL